MKPYAIRAAERRTRLTAALDTLLARAHALGDVREVYVYDSYAAGRVGPHSDLDVVIVRQTSAARHERYDGLALGLDVPVAIDALVLTPSEFAALGDGTTFGRTIVCSMRRVYAAGSRPHRGLSAGRKRTRLTARASSYRRRTERRLLSRATICGEQFEGPAG